ncbi:hypothetical protein A9G42_07435 [Gilliamella sp. Nev6-6]|uniref:RHS repeat-associated core domain-containing protein n=1 Tax=Gilliamella sp. Nev6-6 TaxID=3120252 RepID=UPI00080F3811|nr:RHS repeat-associated core domain-containing protein [Gilliamella apicola]OCG76693.1 hypothetical protein A9G42_07435 [Gilliamella apicola]
MRLTLAGSTLKRCSNLFQTNLWQGSKLIAETDNDKHWQSYLYEPDYYRPLALVHGNAQQDNIKLYWYQNDHLGTPIALTGSLGDTLYECQYNAYGQIINETYHQDDIDSLPNNPLRFQGQYYDEETGLHYNLNRYYDPFTGRYITQDPLGILGGLNSYQYVNGDPINWIDPLGLIKVENNGFEGIAEKEVTHAVTHFPKNPNDLSKILEVEPKVTTTQHKTTRMVWEPNSNTRIRYESHPGDSGIFNPRHHGEHYHIEIKPNNLTWNQAKRQNAIQKVKPEDYKLGHGTGFLPGEKHPGQ